MPECVQSEEWMAVLAGLSQCKGLGKGSLGPGPVSHTGSGTLGKSPSALTWTLSKSNSAERHQQHIGAWTSWAFLTPVSDDVILRTSRWLK